MSLKHPSLSRARHRCDTMIGNVNGPSGVRPCPNPGTHWVEGDGHEDYWLCTEHYNSLAKPGGTIAISDGFTATWTEGGEPG